MPATPFQSLNVLEEKYSEGRLFKFLHDTETSSPNDRHKVSKKGHNNFFPQFWETSGYEHKLLKKLLQSIDKVYQTVSQGDKNFINESHRDARLTY